MSTPERIWAWWKHDSDFRAINQWDDEPSSNLDDVYDHAEYIRADRSARPVTPAEAAKVTEIAALIEAADEALSEYWGQCEGPVIYSMKKIDAALAALKDATK